MIMLEDKVTTRVNIYSSSGEFIRSVVYPLIGTGADPFVAASGAGSGSGAFWLRQRSRTAEGAPWRARLFDTTGRIRDSVALDLEWTDSLNASERAPTASPPAAATQVLADGSILVTRRDRVGFLLLPAVGGARGANEATRVIIADLSATAPEYLPAERADAQRIQDWRERDPAPGRQRQHVVVEPLKSVSSGVAWDNHDRIWVRRTAVGEQIAPRTVFWGAGGDVKTSWADPPRYSAFKRDGTYLGEMQFPVRSIVTFAQRHAWAVVPGDDDVPTLVKYAIPDRDP
jgi:hypothetical protein